MISAIETKVVMTPEEFERRHAARKKKILFKEGAYLKKAGQRSMRYSKKPSKPGKPPNAHKDKGRGPLLRKLWNFAVDVDKDEVISGPMKAGNDPQSVPQVLNDGGRVPVAKLRKQTGFKIGDRGPIRFLGAGKFAAVPIKTEEQAARAARLVAEENAVRAAKGEITIAARPFTKPLLTDGGKKLAELTGSIPL